MKAVINSFEHSELELTNIFSEDDLKKFHQYFEKGKKDFLGIHQEFNGYEVQLKSYYYIGYRWLNKNEYIHIAPKKYNKYQADYLKMFLVCLKDHVVSQHLDETYKIYFDEKWIDISNEEDEITPLLILQFLQIVKKISVKGLKKGYIKVTENLTSKIKGKILVNQTIKQNHFRSRLDKTVCNHQIYTVNCIENQILKTALLQCSRNLHGINNSDISKLLKFNLSLFEQINSKEIFSSDFLKVKYSPFYKEYKEALKLAYMIFKRFGFNLNSEQKRESYTIPPFYINMPELFERYVEVKLRSLYKNDLVAGYGKKNGNSYIFGLRPDFIVKNRKLIIDAKYKYWFENEISDNNFKKDFQQLSLYGRVNEIRDNISLADNEEANILFIYPKQDEKNFTEDEFESVENFSNIKKLGITIPLLS